MTATSRSRRTRASTSSGRGWTRRPARCSVWRPVRRARRSCGSTSVPDTRRPRCTPSRSRCEMRRRSLPPAHGRLRGPAPRITNARERLRARSSVRTAPSLAKAWVGTVRFHSTRLAEKAGYGPFPDGAPLHECISNLSGPGAMGIHWLNGALLTTDLDPAKPQVLVYAPDRHGRLDLVALEYVVFKDAWDSAHPGTMPSLFGEDFMETPAPKSIRDPGLLRAPRVALPLQPGRPLRTVQPAGLVRSRSQDAPCGQRPASPSLTARSTCAVRRRPDRRLRQAWPGRPPTPGPRNLGAPGSRPSPRPMEVVGRVPSSA